MRITVPLIAVSICIVSLFSYATCTEKSGAAAGKKTAAASNTPRVGPKVTFVELGSLNCVPCKMMQPVMKNLETKYPKDLAVVFHDVWTEAGKPAGQKYGIRAIPTQVFLDASGKEISRHEGFFPQEEIEKILKARGVVQ